jgi:hypothetical protein
VIMALTTTCMAGPVLAIVLRKVSSDQYPVSS